LSGKSLIRQAKREEKVQARTSPPKKGTGNNSEIRSKMRVSSGKASKGKSGLGQKSSLPRAPA